MTASTTALVRETVDLLESISSLLTRQTEDGSPYTPMSVLDEMIAAGWGDVPQNRIPDTWREVAPPEAESRKKTFALAAMKSVAAVKKRRAWKEKARVIAERAEAPCVAKWQLYKQNDSSWAQLRKEKKEKRQEDLKNRMLAQHKRFDQALMKHARSARSVWAAETIIDCVERFIVHHGRTPTQSDFCPEKGLPSPRTVRRLLGGPRAAVCAAKARLNGRGVS